MSRNGFPKYIFGNLYQKISASRQGKNIVNKDNIPTIWIRLPDIGHKFKHLLKQCIRKVKRNCTIDIKIVILLNTKNISYYCSVKDKVPIAQRSSIIYHLFRVFKVLCYFLKNKICSNRAKSLLIVNPILSAKTVRILRWNDVLLFNFTFYSTML